MARAIKFVFGAKKKKKKKEKEKEKEKKNKPSSFFPQQQEPSRMSSILGNLRKKEMKIFKSNFQIFFLATQKKTHHPNLPHEVHHLGGLTQDVKMGSFIPPLVYFLDLCIFALVRKL